MRITLALVIDTFREALARWIFIGLFILSTLMILFFLFLMRIDIVQGGMAAISLFGQAGRTQDLNRLVGNVYGGIATFLYSWGMGLARAGRPEAAVLLESVRRRAATAAAFVREAWREVALPACEGVYAYARGDYTEAWRHLTLSVPRMVEIGGSHAQRDLFQQILSDTLVRVGRTGAAQQMLELRRVSDPQGVPVNRALAEVYARLGLPELAERARARATLTRARHP